MILKGQTFCLDQKSNTDQFPRLRVSVQLRDVQLSFFHARYLTVCAPTIRPLCDCHPPHRNRPQLANATNAQRAEYDALTRDAAAARQRCDELELQRSSLARTLSEQQAAAARVAAETAASTAERDHLESARAELGACGGQRCSRQ